MIDILQTAGADSYIPKFARHRVSIETMLCMSDEDLKEVRELISSTPKNSKKYQREFLFVIVETF